ncbi:hypothetical protein T484DRAFT_1843280 [Baffinella frigidus]|nr:hypothetical protein T484DRAFT_1843280 [Cryptophyta sp. CCMP2293]
MPSHFLMSAGRQLLEERKSEREAMTRVREVVSEIAREFEMVQQSLDNTERDLGTWRKSKKEAVEEFTKASKQAKKTQRNLTRAKLELEEAVEEEEQSGSPAGLEQVKQLSASVAASEAEVRSQRARMKRALSSLARFEPDFPEVMVHLESALPRELLQVWRPDCALEDMFVAREKLRVGGRHAVWRCSDGEQGGEEFAVKVAP